MPSRHDAAKFLSFATVMSISKHRCRLTILDSYAFLWKLMWCSHCCKSAHGLFHNAVTLSLSNALAFEKHSINYFFFVFVPCGALCFFFSELPYSFYTDKSWFILQFGSDSVPMSSFRCLWGSKHSTHHVRAAVCSFGIVSEVERWVLTWVRVPHAQKANVFEIVCCFSVFIIFSFFHQLPAAFKTRRYETVNAQKKRTRYTPYNEEP